MGCFLVFHHHLKHNDEKYKKCEKYVLKSSNMQKMAIGKCEKVENQ
jgi:hypothetical protein